MRSITDDVGDIDGFTILFGEGGTKLSMEEWWEGRREGGSWPEDILDCFLSTMLSMEAWRERRG